MMLLIFRIFVLSKNGALYSKSLSKRLVAMQIKNFNFDPNLKIKIM